MKRYKKNCSKRELILDVLATTNINLSTTQAEIFFNACLDKMSEKLKKKYTLEFRGFGTLKVIKRAKRKARNPRTNEVVEVPEKLRVVFKPGVELKKIS
jgi:integration host factor subunit beta